MTSMPTKPTITAPHCPNDTRSPSSQELNDVAMSGAAKKMATASSKGIALNARQ